MGILNIFGIGSEKLFVSGKKTVGCVGEIQYFKIPNNTESLCYDTFGPQNGAPALVHFTYTVNGREHKGIRYAKCGAAIPMTGDELTVYYDPDNPSSYAVKI